MRKVAIVAAMCGAFAVIAATPDERIEALRMRAREIVSKMTLEEKVSQLMNWSAAVPRLGISDYDWWSEALHGVARNGRATVFPEPIGIAATFDAPLVHEIASAIGDEARVKYEAAQAAGRHGAYCAGLTFWSPNVNIYRDPRWGRGMETWGEDPYLTSRMGVQFVKGLQGDDPVYLKAAACAKHYAVHSGPESQRHSFDVSPSKRDLYETYLPAFRALVQEGGVEAVMGAYNRVYGESASASAFLLKDILRGEFGFRGHVVSDCGAVTDIYNGHALEKTAEGASARAIGNGLDIECGKSFNALAKAVREGLVSEKLVDEAVVHLFTTRLRLGILERDDACPYRAEPAKLCSKEHVALARRAAAESMVLLKNDGVLPIDEAKTKTLGVMGAAALDGFALMGNYYGISPNLVTYLEGLSAAVGSGTGIHFAPGYYYGMSAEKASGVYAEDDIVIAFVGNTGIFEGEEGDAMGSSGKCGDRATLAIPSGQMQFLRNLRRSCEGRKPKAKIVTVVTCGGPVETDELMKLSDALVVAWYGGEQGGSALAELLLGRADFTGRLPITFPVSADVLPPFEDYSMDGRTYRYQTEGVAFPFGYGLSYASAEYEAVKVSGDFRRASVRLRNAGSRTAFETVQVYVATPNSGKGSPNVSLRGFARVEVPAGKTIEADVALDPESFTEVGIDGVLRPVAGKCTVWAAAAAPCPRSRELGARACSTVVDAVPKLLFFKTASCRRCVRLERDLFSTQKWADFADGRIALERIDMDGAEGGAAAEARGVAAKGSFVLVSPGGGRAASRLLACEEPEVVIPWIRKAIVEGDAKRP